MMSIAGSMRALPQKPSRPAAGGDDNNDRELF